MFVFVFHNILCNNLSWHITVFGVFRSDSIKIKLLFTFWGEWTWFWWFVGLFAYKKSLKLMPRQNELLYNLRYLLLHWNRQKSTKDTCVVVRSGKKANYCSMPDLVVKVASSVFALFSLLSWEYGTNRTSNNTRQLSLVVILLSLLILVVYSSVTPQSVYPNTLLFSSTVEMFVLSDMTQTC